MKKLYRCAECNRQTTTKHEIIFGRGNRDICIDYNIQLPLCPSCHHTAHGIKLLQGYSPLQRFVKIEISGRQVIDQHKIKEHLLSKLRMNYYKTAMGVRNSMHRGYLDKNKKKCGEIIKTYEIT